MPARLKAVETSLSAQILLVSALYRILVSILYGTGQSFGKELTDDVLGVERRVIVCPSFALLPFTKCLLSSGVLRLNFSSFPHCRLP